MTQIVFPHPLTDGTDAYGSHVMNDLIAIQDVVQGQLDNSNLKSGAGIVTDRLADLAVNYDKLATDAVYGNRILDDGIAAVKQKSDDTAGEGCNLNTLFSAADGGEAPTNIMANRQDRGGLTVWSYYSETAAVTERVLDENIDWRERLVIVHMIGFDSTASPKGALPGGANEALIRMQSWESPGGGGEISEEASWGMFYSQAGNEGGTAGPELSLYLGDDGGIGAIVVFYARDTDGALCAWVDSMGVADIDMILCVTASPQLEIPA